MNQSFRLMTANLLSDRGRPEALAELLAREEPDLLVTQELSRECAAVIADFFPNHHLRPSSGFAGRGVGSRFPASFGDIDMPVRTGTWAMVELNGRLLRLVGMHLANPVQFPWWTSLRARVLQLDALFDWVDAGEADLPLVVAGDLNATPNWPAYKKMAERWTDLVATAFDHEGETPELTWAWRPGWPRLLRIDHVLGLGVEARNAKVEPVPGSDHHAVIIDLEWPQRDP